MALPPIFQKQIGPFKLWQWSAFVGVGVAAGLLWRTFGSTEKVESDAEKASPPVIATEPVGYVYTEEDGKARLDRPDYESAIPVQSAPSPQQAPVPGSAPGNSGVVNPSKGQMPPITTIPVPAPNTPNMPGSAGKPSPVSALKAVASGTKITVTWLGNDQAHRVIINDNAAIPSANVGISPYGAQSLTFDGVAGRTYKLVAYKQLKPGVNSDPTAPVSVTVGAATQGTGEGSYPGLARGYIMDCATADTHHNMRSLSEVDVSGLGTTLKARKLTAWAICNTGSPSYPSYAVDYWTGSAQAAVRAASNKDRVRWGLYPLTDAEWDKLTALQKSMLPKGNLDERNAVFQSLQYANALFNQFNLPYQCGRMKPRSEVTRNVTDNISVRH